MIIDSHSHVILPVKEHIRLMDEAGVDKTILFGTSIHPEAAKNTAEFEKEMLGLQEIISGKRNANEVKRASNKEVADVIRRYPDRFIGFGNIPYGLTLEETTKLVQEQVVANNFVGIGECAIPSGQVSALQNIFAVAKDFGNLPIWIHAFWPLISADIQDLAAMARDFPSVPLIVGHLGGLHWLEVIAIAKEQSNVYIDLSAAFTTIAPKMVIAEVPQQCLFSADMPYGDVLMARTVVERVCQDPQVRKLVLGDNIRRIVAGGV